MQEKGISDFQAEQCHLLFVPVMFKDIQNNSKIQNYYIISRSGSTEVLEQEGCTILKYTQFSQKLKRFQKTIRDCGDIEIVLDCTEIYQIHLISLLISM